MPNLKMRAYSPQNRKKMVIFGINLPVRENSQTSSFQSVTNKTDRHKTSHLFVYSRRATHDPHHTWHGDRGSPHHFIVSPLGAIENVRENALTVGKCF